MKKGVRTIISCPCCEKIFIENCRYNKQWNEHRKRTDFQQFRKYLNLALSRRNTGLMTKGMHMKLGEREICGPEEISHIVPRNKDRKSLLYQAEFVAEKKRENFLRNEVCTSRKMNNFEQQRKRENFLRNEERNDQVKNDLLKYDEDLTTYDNTKEMNSADQRGKVERNREQMWFPKISQETQLNSSGSASGSAVIKFTDENVKLDIYLPNLA